MLIARSKSKSRNGLSQFCGIDWATDHHDVAVVDDDGTLVARGRVGKAAIGLAAVVTLC
jgi:hypothetical protein